MQGVMTVILDDRSIMPQVIHLDKPPGLDVLQGAVGGYIERVPNFDTIQAGSKRVRCVVYCNEEGKLEGQPLNYNATVLWDAELKRLGYSNATDTFIDILVGDVVILTGDAAFMKAL